MDKYTKEHKYFLELSREEDMLTENWRNRPWIKLEKPVQSGWLAYYDLRDDISRREDVERIREALAIGCPNEVYIRRPDHVRLIRQGKIGAKLGKYEMYFSFLPRKRIIHPKKFEQTVPKNLRKFFSHGHHGYGIYRYEGYKLNFPDYWLVLKVKHRMISRYKEHDPMFDSRIAEIRQIKIQGDYYRKFYSRWGGKYGNKIYQRHLTKRRTQQIIDYDLNPHDEAIPQSRIKTIY